MTNDIDRLPVTLNLTYKQAAMLSHAIAEFQDSFHALSHEDHMISEDDVIQLENLVMQVLSATEIEPNTVIMPSAFASDEEIAEYNEAFPDSRIG
jgi:hypothetical protein